MRGFIPLFLSASAASAASTIGNTVFVTQTTGFCPVPVTSIITSTVGIPLTTSIATSKSASKVTSTPASSYVYASDTSLPSGVPIATLTPKVHWNTDTSHPKHLIPQGAGVKQELYFEQSEASGKIPMGLASLAFTCPSIILDHSSLIASVSYTSGGLVITFTNDAAFQQALRLWECGDEGLFLVTYTAGCGGYDAGERCYFKATSLEFSVGSLSLTAGGYACALEEAITEFDLQWGYRKRAPKTISTFAGSSSTTAYYAASSTTTSAPSHPTSTSSVGYGSNPATNSSTTSNTTVVSGNNTFYDSCVAPIDTKYGLPTACLDEYFDLVLDDNFGYNETDYQSWVDAYASGTEYADDYDNFDSADDTEYDEEDDDDLFDFNYTEDISNGTYTVEDKRRMTRRESIKSRSLFSAVGNAIGKAVQKVAAQIPVKGLGKDLTKQFSKGQSFQVPKDSTLKNKDLKIVTSPWGQAVLIKSFGEVKTAGDKTSGASLNVYCVDCGVSGSADITGVVSGSVKNGFSQGQITFNANFKAGLKIGVDAQAVYKNTFSSDLFEVQLSSIQIPGIASLGPSISLGASVDFSAEAQGQLLAGAEFSLQNAQSVVDFIDSKKSTSSGWTPQFVPVLQATGNLSVSAELDLPIAVSVGVNILSGKWKKSVGIVDTPALKAEAEISGSIGLSDSNKVTGSITETNGCTGIATTISFKNSIYVNVLDLQKFWLVNPDFQPVTQGCIAIGSSKSKRSYPTLSHPSLEVRADNSTSANLTDVTSHVVSNVTSLDYSDPVYPNNPFNTTNETLIYEYTVLHDSSRAFNLTACGDGNMYIQYANSTLDSDDCTSMFASQSDIIVGDATGRLLHYYPNTMSKVNVSRLRLAPADNMPESSIPVFLDFDASYEDENGEPIYFAVDPLENIFYPVVCTYTNTSLTAKVFLVADPVDGLTMLQSEDVMYSITGGEVDSCYNLPLIQGDDIADWYDYDEELDGEDEVGNAEYDDDDDLEFDYSNDS